MSDDYAAGYADGRRDALLGMLSHLCEELHSGRYSEGYEEGAKA